MLEDLFRQMSYEIKDPCIRPLVFPKGLKIRPMQAKIGTSMDQQPSTERRSGIDRRQSIEHRRLGLNRHRGRQAVER